MGLWWENTCNRIIHLTVLLIFIAGLQEAALDVLNKAASKWSSFRSTRRWEKGTDVPGQAAHSSPRRAAPMSQLTTCKRNRITFTKKSACPFSSWRKTASLAFIFYLKEHEYKSDFPSFWIYHKKNSTIEMLQGSQHSASKKRREERGGRKGGGEKSAGSGPDPVLRTLRNSSYSVQTIVNIQFLEPSVSSHFDNSKMFQNF